MALTSMQQDARDVARTWAQVQRPATPWQPAGTGEQLRGELLQVVGKRVDGGAAGDEPGAFSR